METIVSAFACLVSAAVPDQVVVMQPGGWDWVRLLETLIGTGIAATVAAIIGARAGGHVQERVAKKLALYELHAKLAQSLFDLEAAADRYFCALISHRGTKAKVPFYDDQEEKKRLLEQLSTETAELQERQIQLMRIHGQIVLRLQDVAPLVGRDAIDPRDSFTPEPLPEPVDVGDRLDLVQMRREALPIITRWAEEESARIRAEYHERQIAPLSACLDTLLSLVRTEFGVKSS